MSKMRVVQVTHPKGALELVEREFRSLALDRCASRLKLAAFATAILSQKKAPGRASSTRGCLDMRSPESSMRWG